MPKREKALMDIARVYQGLSTCTRNQVGAIISIEGRVISSGYNGAPAGMPHCDHTCTCPIDMRMVGAASPHALDCPKVAPCKLAVHAEANAIAFAARNGLPVLAASLHTTLSPCYVCAQLIINAGITRVVFDRDYRDLTGVYLLVDAGVTIG